MTFSRTSKHQCPNFKKYCVTYKIVFSVRQAAPESGNNEIFILGLHLLRVHDPCHAIDAHYGTCIELDTTSCRFVQVVDLDVTTRNILMV